MEGPEGYPRALFWEGDADGVLVITDQRALPERFELLRLSEVEALFNAIRSLAVRGAPAIGVAAAYGVVLGCRGAAPGEVAERAAQAIERLAQSRPTAVNLFWALDRMRRAAAQLQDTPPEGRRERLLHEAQAIHRQDEATCAAIGRQGAALIARRERLLTHCNAGALATGGMGTALAIIYQAHAAGRIERVYVDETRPLFQGARLTAWELKRAGVPVTLICDHTAASAMAAGRVDRIIVGADRIAANGDVANKIGTYPLALAAAAHDLPFHVAAPLSTFDPATPTGADIPIEERSAEEVTCPQGRRVAPAGLEVWSPAFDVTPARLIRSIITERGVIERPDVEALRAHLAG